MNWINTKCSIFPQNWAETMPCCKISNCAQMSKTIIAVRHFGLGGRESLETAVTINLQKVCWQFATDLLYSAKYLCENVSALRGYFFKTRAQKSSSALACFSFFVTKDFLKLNKTEGLSQSLKFAKFLRMYPVFFSGKHTTLFTLDSKLRSLQNEVAKRFYLKSLNEDLKQ